jgi:hypothetical protein
VNTVMPGADTVTGSLRITVTPGADALTVVFPLPIGSNATPPLATVVGVLNCSGSIVTTRVCPAPAVVTSCATSGLVCVTVTGTAVPPTRTAWYAQKNVLPGNTTPIRT